MYCRRRGELPHRPSVKKNNTPLEQWLVGFKSSALCAYGYVITVAGF